MGGSIGLSAKPARDMRHFFYNFLIVFLGLAVIPAVLAGDRLSIKRILDHPAEYQAKVVTVEGRAKAITNLPVHLGTPRCGGSAVYDSQTFTLQDESGRIGIGTAGTCRPNATQLFVKMNKSASAESLWWMRKTPRPVP